MPEGAEPEGFCCHGCAAVFALLRADGLTRFYALAGDRLGPVNTPDSKRPWPWLEPLLETAEAAGEVCAVEVDVQGIRCAGCVWLMEELFRRTPGGIGLLVNPGLGRARLTWRKSAFDVPGFLRRVEAFGYQFGPPLKTDSVDPLTWRLGVCAALTVNVMLFSIAFYFGLAPREVEVFGLFTALSLVLSTLTVAIGGWPFFQAAWRGLKEGVLHLDLPIALGIALVFATSLVQAKGGRGDRAYFDTLNVFITLMLFGRWLQRRLVEANRHFLLEDGGLSGLVCRRVEGQTVRVVPASAVREGDFLLVAPGELVAVDARLEGSPGQLSLDWISGESTPRPVAAGARVPAGSFNAGQTALQLVAEGQLSSSGLLPLLRQVPTARAPDAFWNRLARNWAAKVLTVSAAGFLLWLPAGVDRALDVAVALLVVTCPCAIGLSIPLAFELVQSGLRRQGFYVRTTDLLSRLRQVRKVLFDKTGTLTLGRLELANPAALEALAPSARDAMFNLACRSGHPVSACVAAGLSRQGAHFDAAATAREVPGQGVEGERSGQTWKLGRAAWAIGGSGPGTVLACDGREVARVEVQEALRPQAASQLRALERGGYEVWLLSGDTDGRVQAFAQRLGLSPSRVRGGQSPDAKAALVEQLDRGDTLYLGDGVNDAPAFAAALCAGTPAIDRPVMPSRSAFFFVGDGLSALTQALAASHRLHAVVQRVLTVSLAYNLLAVAAGLAGLITPLRAALFMPLSSLSVLALTVLSLRDRRPAPSTALEPAEATA